LNTVPERLGREACKYNGVECSKTDDGKESDDGFGNHGHVNCDGVPFFDTQVFEHIRDFAYFSEEFAISEVPALAGLIGLVNNGNLQSTPNRDQRYAVRIFNCVSIDQVVAGAQFSVREPGHVAVGKGASPYGGEVLVPGDQIPSKVSPELIRVLN